MWVVVNVYVENVQLIDEKWSVDILGSRVFKVRGYQFCSQYLWDVVNVCNYAPRTYTDSGLAKQVGQRRAPQA